MTKMEKLIIALREKKNNEEAVRAQFTEKAKTKALTANERLLRIEKILGLESPD